MKNTQCLDGINSKVKKAEENVNVPENKEIEAIQNETESNWKKKMKRASVICWESITWSNIWVLSILERKSEKQTMFWKIGWNFSKFDENYKPTDPSSSIIHSKINIRKSTPRDIIIKLLPVIKRKLKVLREKRHYILRKKIRMTADFLSETGMPKK